MSRQSESIRKRIRQLSSFFAMACCAVAFAAAMSTISGQDTLFTAPYLTDAGKEWITYQNERVKLGLYEGANEMPLAHRQAGEAIARSIVPLNSNGQPDKQNGTIKMSIIGHSIPANIFGGIDRDLFTKEREKGRLNPKFKFVSGADPAELADEWVQYYESNPPHQLALRSISPDLQILCIQVTWIPALGARNYENYSLKQRIADLRGDIIRIARAGKQKAPNLKMILFNSDTYMGHHGRHEPYHAYEEALIFRSLIMDQINGDPELAFDGANARVPWFGWGAILWDPTDPIGYYRDRVHPSEDGVAVNRERFLDGILSNPVVSMVVAGENATNIAHFRVAPHPAAEFSLSASTGIHRKLFQANGALIGSATHPGAEAMYTPGESLQFKHRGNTGAQIRVVR